MPSFDFFTAAARRAACAIALALASLAVPQAAQSEPTEPSSAGRQTPVAEFLGRYCAECHSAGSAEGDRQFDSFRLPLTSVDQLITADEIVDQVTLKLMPPEDAGQPTEEKRLELLDVLRKTIESSRERFNTSGGQTVLRRLSNREYENTLATLFDRRVDTLGLTADFPKDNTVAHMDNLGDALVTSGFLLDQYLQSASRLVEARLGKTRMEPKTWHFRDNFQQYEELSGAHRSVFNYEYLCLYEQPNTDTRQGGYGHIEDFLKGVPVAGLYDIEVHAQAMHRDTHYDPKIFRIDFSEPFQLAVVPGDVTKGHIHYPQAIEPVLGQAIVPDEQPEWLKFRVWLEAGQTPRFIFPNGPYESRASVIEVNKQYKDEFDPKKYKAGVSRTHILREGELPHIRIGEIKVHGPISEPQGGKEEVAVFGPDGFQVERAVEQLHAFGRRAYRRPLEPSDRGRIRAFYQQRLDEDATPRQAALDTLKMILCSPSFLYLSEITAENETLLGPFDLAARLSYALWAAPPDDVLFAAAESGRLTAPEELKKHVIRMLEDDRSDAFVNGFTDSWLNLREIGNLPPPRKSVPQYYSENLPESMKREARQFFRYLLDQNRPVSEFLDADYTFVDKKLAKLYGLPQQDTLRLADGFQRVSLVGNQQRGGVLGMAGVLTVSANGVDTSPVTRGVWVMENILGITPPPPPDEVPSIDADVSGATTIREKLSKHSEDKTCFVCHRNIDPLGYALETYDPIGRWRTNYPSPKGKGSAATIDASGELPSGESFEDFASFKKVLHKSRGELFVRNLIEKLATYATGRQMEHADRFRIDDLAARLHSDDASGLRTMVVEVLTSELFRSR
ncbi:hypothetical protein Mal15_69130 [Stieleria maiorica]|uniref:Planctomycete cytochrome C n=1 Tax=Stieleria maiorica TaxID=2795974 RepID=A0A5B9MN16_9BACT|nr:DUF1592 domain-containing protein [Stieleria maiorica]QEG02792.1 hypothetical protein Mal15_69130 [Stieleria maiorica]